MSLRVPMLLLLLLLLRLLLLLLHSRLVVVLLLLLLLLYLPNLRRETHLRCVPSAYKLLAQRNMRVHTASDELDCRVPEGGGGSRPRPGRDSRPGRLPQRSAVRGRPGASHKLHPWWRCYAGGFLGRRLTVLVPRACARSRGSLGGRDRGFHGNVEMEAAFVMRIRLRRWRETKEQAFLGSSSTSSS